MVLVKKAERLARAKHFKDVPIKHSEPFADQGFPEASPGLFLVHTSFPSRLRAPVGRSPAGAFEPLEETP